MCSVFIHLLSVTLSQAVMSLSVKPNRPKHSLTAFQSLPSHIYSIDVRWERFRTQYTILGFSIFYPLISLVSTNRARAHFASLTMTRLSTSFRFSSGFHPCVDVRRTSYTIDNTLRSIEYHTSLRSNLSAAADCDGISNWRSWVEHSPLISAPTQPLRFVVHPPLISYINQVRNNNYTNTAYVRGSVDTVCMLSGKDVLVCGDGWPSLPQDLCDIPDYGGSRVKPIYPSSIILQVVHSRD
jgi:hypothetical protein